MSSSSDAEVTLEVFVHQVSGHFPMASLDNQLVCKAFNEREHRFYTRASGRLRPWLPAFEGTMEVEAAEDADGFITLRGTPPVNYLRKRKQSKPGSASPVARSKSSTSECSTTETVPIVGTPPQFRLKRRESAEFNPSTSLPISPSHFEKLMNDRKNSFEECISPPASAPLFCNPWALKCHRHHLQNLGILQKPDSDLLSVDVEVNTSSEDISSASEPLSQAGKKVKKKNKKAAPPPQNPQVYLLLENLVAGYTHPCVIDIKIGTRQYADNVSTAKKERKMAKAASSTISTLGLRLSGMQVYRGAGGGRFLCRDKYYGRALSDDGFFGAIEEYLLVEPEDQDEKPSLRLDVLEALDERVAKMAKTVESLESYRFYTSSLLITYDGEQKNVPGSQLINLRIIDFAHATFEGLDDEVKHEGPDQGFLFGLKSLRQILSKLKLKWT